MENFENIELTYEESQEALRVARAKKAQAIKIQEWNDRIKEPFEWYVPTALDLHRQIRKTKSMNGDEYEINDDNKEVVAALCLYFAKDSRFKGSLSKGILLMGKPGTGKTHLMNFFSKNPHASYIVPTCKHIAEQYRNGWSSNEMDTIQYYSVLKRAEIGHPFNQTELGACFGDLGAESEANSYGNKKNVMEEILFNRYETHLPFNMTHFTTNLDVDDIERIYGSRMRDRLREMCNVFILQGKSFR